MLGFSGNLFSIPTPLTDDGRAVSEVRTHRMIRSLVERRAVGFQVCGEAGEFLSLSIEERKVVLEWVLREAQTDLPVVTNVSSLATHESVLLAQHAGQSGARAVVITPPYVGTYTPQESSQHLKAVASFCSVPVIVVANRILMQDHAYDCLRTMPHVHIVEGRNWDFWATEGVASHMSLSYSDLLGADRVIIDKLISTFGPASFAKAAFEHLDISVGALRAPKLPIPMAQFAKSVPMVA